MRFSSGPARMPRDRVTAVLRTTNGKQAASSYPPVLDLLQLLSGHWLPLDHASPFAQGVMGEGGGCLRQDGGEG